MALSKGFGYYALLAIAVISLFVAVFDVITDWIAFRQFVRYDGGKLTVGLGIFCTVSTILVFFEVRNQIFRYRLTKKKYEGEGTESAESSSDGREFFLKDPEESRLQLWFEVTTFLVLILEDLPVGVILYIVYDRGNCSLFKEIFQESIVAKLVLLGTILSALWKLIMSFVYCCRVCTCEFRHVKWYAVCCCCCWRFLRPLLAIIVLAFACYFYSKAHVVIDSVRPDCIAD